MTFTKKYRFVEKGEIHMSGSRPKTDSDAQDRCLGCLYFGCGKKVCESPAFDSPVYVTVSHRHQCYIRGLAVFKQGYEEGMAFDKVLIR